MLDADVVSHFSKAERLSFLFGIFPECQYLLLDTVYEELTRSRQSKMLIDNVLRFFSSRISKIQFSPRGESMREYARLIRFLGKGESACMVYCRDHEDVLGSSNLRDIKEYDDQGRMRCIHRKRSFQR